MGDNARYLMRRMLASEQAARDARHPAAREAHLTLATLYKEKWLVARTALQFPTPTSRPTQALLKSTYVLTEFQ